MQPWAQPNSRSLTKLTESDLSNLEPAPSATQGLKLGIFPAGPPASELRLSEPQAQAMLLLRPQVHPGSERERERARERERDRETERQREMERQSERYREKYADKLNINE